MSRRAVTSWFLTCGSEICVFCLQVYIYEHRRHCEHCDTAICLMCAMRLEAACLCPTCCGTGEED